MRKVVVPNPTSKRIGTFGLSRRLLVDFLNRVFTEVAPEYANYRNDRMQDDRFVRYRMTITAEDSKRHLFTLTLDDTTSSEHLILVELYHRILDD